MPVRWRELDEKNVLSVPARPEAGMWTPVRSYLSSGTLLRIEASGRWQPLPKLDCGPDGLRHWAYGRDRLLTKSAPLGALIGRVGGSALSASEAEIFVIGSLAVLKVDKEGPLFLTINDAPDGFEDNDGAVSVTIE